MHRVIVVVAVVALAGCGRKATRADCEHFFDRNVEIQMRSEGVTDEPSIKQRQTSLRSTQGEDIDKCVGRRITDGMLKCADEAQTGKEIDKCLR
ncbi:MAG: hypothetical protein KIT84_07770 [Labilithrix sp.]|nr:hypothetical protein [Labilithrix sp.]MCW5810894.1 hypothetical protein [Labilithrix sp.]